MLNLVYVATSLAFAFAMFHQTMCYNSVNRAYLGMYKGLFESCVIAYDTSGNYLAQPFFDRDLVKASLQDYYALNLEPYVMEYNVRTVFCDYYGNSAKRVKPTVVKVYLTAKISEWQQYSRNALFTIKAQG